MNIVYVGRLSVENHTSLSIIEHILERDLMHAEDMGKHLVRNQPYCTSKNSYRGKTL